MPSLDDDVVEVRPSPAVRTSHFAMDVCSAGASCAPSASASMYAHAAHLLGSLWAQVEHQMKNEFLAGSFALALASVLTSWLWRLLAAARLLAHDRVFTTYEIPSGTPQYFAALRWLHDQPAVRRASRRLVLNPVDAPDAPERTGDAPPDDPDDPLELGLHTVPMLLRHQSLCARVGAALVWAGHGGAAGADLASSGPGGFGYHSYGGGGDDPLGLGAMGGGGARGSWYAQLLSGSRGHAGLASASALGWPGASSSAAHHPAGLHGHGPVAGVGGAFGSVRLRVLSLDPPAALRAVLERGRRLGRGTARRYTQVYLPSTALAPVRVGRNPAANPGWTRPEWVDAGRKPARPIASVILKANDARDVLEDARAFLRLERWYAERGIPYRRGYLLHGPPGSGKTSLVCAVAGELRLPVYQMRLSGAGLDDEAFHRLLAGTARRSVVLLEDVDAAAGAAVGAPESGDAPLTLPGLLNALDGAGAVDGRLLFMTCHRAEALEPALVRPGRIDRRLAFTAPDAAQAGALFRHFYGGATPRRDVVDDKRDAKKGENGEGKGEGETPKDAEGQCRATNGTSSNGASTNGASSNGASTNGASSNGHSSKSAPRAFGGAPPPLDPLAVRALAESFALAVGDDGKHPGASSMAALQGHLMMHREDPEGAVAAFEASGRSRPKN